jgi:hypothetical protein
VAVPKRRALILGTNPYPVILTGLLHYDVFHIFCLVASCRVWQWALEDPGERPDPMIWSGLFWGACTLVRPLTLVFPPFALAAILLRGQRSLRRGLLRFAALTLGMIVVIAPYTLRNHRVTGRWVPVNAEGWMALWGSTVREFGMHPNHYNWGQLYPDAFMGVFGPVTGESVYSRAAFIDNNLALEDAFRERAIWNIRQHPLVYLRNGIRSLLTLNLQINSVLIKIFQHIQQPGVWPSQDWFRIGHPQDFYDPLAARILSVLVGLLTLLAACGAVLGIRQREAWAVATGSVYLAICVAHTLSYMDLMYYYVKFPFLLVFAAGLLDRLRGAAPYSRASLGGVLASLLLALSLFLSLVVFTSA